MCIHICNIKYMCTHSILMRNAIRLSEYIGPLVMDYNWFSDYQANRLGLSVQISPLVWCITKAAFSTPNRACPVYQTPPLFPYLDANYVTRSTTNAICLSQENCSRQIALVVDDHRLVFYLNVLDQVRFRWICKWTWRQHWTATPH